MITIIGNQDESGGEFQAAVELKGRILKAWPHLTDNAQDHILIVVGAKCHGQVVRDIDLLLLGSFKSGLVKVHPFLAFSNREGDPERPDEVEIESLFLVIEVKGHPPEKVKFVGTQVQVQYGGRAIVHNASQQNESQKQSVINYMKLRGISSRPWVTPLIWLINISNKDLPERPHNILGSEAGWLYFLNVTVQMSPPRQSSGGWLLSARFPNDQIFNQVISLFTETITPTKLDRRRMEQINQRVADDLNLQETVGKKLLILRGRGGTGKTIRLLRLAKRLYDENSSRVLVLTYNLALVADLRRLLTIMGIGDGLVDRSIQIQTVHSFFYALFQALGIIDIHEDEFLEKYDLFKQEALTLLTEEALQISDLDRVKEANFNAFYWDYIFIDEGQDWPEDEQLLLFKLYPYHNFVVADGVDQLIRNHVPANWRKGLNLHQTKIIPLKKCLRMKAGLTRVIAALASELGLPQSEWEPEEQVPGGRIIVVEGNDLEQLKNLILKLIQETREAGNEPVDMLFCVPPRLVQQTATNVRLPSLPGRLFEAWGLKVWDGSSPLVREVYPTDIQQLRLVQYESCRGLEGWTTVLFEFDEFFRYKLDRIEQSEKDPFRARLQAARWLLIPLTRSLDTLVIHLRGESSLLKSTINTIARTYPDIIEWHRFG